MMRYLLASLFLLFAIPSFAQLPTGTDVFIASCKLTKEGIEFSEAINITNREGYDNQPSFSPDGKKVYFVSIKEDGQSDVYAYTINSKQIEQITQTKESEYSPKFFGKEKGFKVVRVELDSVQLFWQYNQQAQPQSAICKSIDSIGYYCPINNKQFAFFKITELPSLWLFDSGNCNENYLTSGIGRSLHALEEKYLYFTQMKDTVRWIVRYDLDSKVMKALIPCVIGSEDFALLGEDSFCMSKGSQFFTWDSKQGGDWKLSADFSKQAIRNIKRLTFNAEKNQVSFVNDASNPK